MPNRDRSIRGVECLRAGVMTLCRMVGIIMFDGQM